MICGGIDELNCCCWECGMEFASGYDAEEYSYNYCPHNDDNPDNWDDDDPRHEY